MKEEKEFCGLSYWTWLAIIVAWVLILSSLSSCATKKTQMKVDDLEKRVETLHAYVISQTSQSIDTTKKVNTNIVTETVQFFNPNEINDYERYLALVQAQDLLYGNAGLVKSITKLEDKTSLIQSGVTSTQSIVTVDSTKTINSQISKREQTKIEEISFWQRYKWYFIGFCSLVFITALVFFLKKFNPFCVPTPFIFINKVKYRVILC